MDKETLLSRFKPSFGEPDAGTQMYGDTGISVRTLDVYADNLLPGITDDNVVTDDFIKGHVNILKAMGGQLRHEKSEFVKNYKHQGAGGQGGQGDNGGNGGAEGDEKVAMLEKAINDLKEQLESQGKRNTLESLHKHAIDKAKTLKVQHAALWNDVVKMTEVKDGMDGDAFTDTVKSVYEEKLKSYFGDGAAPYGGNGSGGQGGSGDKEAAKAKREAFKQRMRSQGKLPSEG